MRKGFNKIIHIGTTTDTYEKRLIDENASFLTGSWPVRTGDTAVLEVDDDENISTVVTEVVSDTELALKDDIFTSVGQAYRIVVGDIYLTGTTTSASNRKLIDSSATFVSSGVRPRMIAYNPSTDLEAVILDVSETELTLSKNIFSSNDAYEVYSGDTFFQREYEELRTRKFIIAGDDTEISTTSTVEEKLKELLFSSSSSGYLIKALNVIVEAKVTSGTLYLYLKMNGNTVATSSTTSTSYTILTLSSEKAIEDGTVVDMEIYGKVSSGTGYIRLTEIYAIV